MASNLPPVFLQDWHGCIVFLSRVLAAAKDTGAATLLRAVCSKGEQSRFGGDRFLLDLQQYFEHHILVNLLLFVQLCHTNTLRLVDHLLET